MRKNTIKVLEMVEDGLMSKEFIIEAALSYMSDDEVLEMLLDYIQYNGIDIVE